MKGLSQAHEIYPNMSLSVRVTELERDVINDATGSSTIFDELRASMSQKQVYWMMLPMCDDEKDVQEYINMINHIDPLWLKNHGALQIVCETPRGIQNLDNILGEHPEIQGVIAGGGDYFRFAQCKDNLLLPHLRFEILNTCLAHGRVPIDTPPLSLGESGTRHFQSAHDFGFRSGVLLHPTQVKTVNEIFSPTQEQVEENKIHIDPWLEKRQTGYKRNSGDDFIGPPHMKQRHWQLKFHDHILAKKRSRVQTIDKDVIHKVQSLLASVHDSYSSQHTSSNFLNTLMFIAISSSCHARHEDLLANLGFSNVKVFNNANENPSNFEDAAYTSSQIIGRRLTSTGQVIVTYKVQILDENFQTLCEVERRLLERKLTFDDHANEGVYPHTHDHGYKRLTPSCVKEIISKPSTQLINDIPFNASISEEVHAEYCKLLKLDAPLHHTRDILPTVPSTLHLAHHQQSLSDEYLTADSYFQNITFHAPLKPNEKYSTKKFSFVNEEGKNDYLSVLNDADGNLLSSMLIQRDRELAMKEI